MLRSTVAAVAFALLCRTALALPTPERVQFESLDRDGDRAIRIEALLYKPSGDAPAAGRAAVIALHGCSGLYSTVKGRRDQPSPRHAARAEAMLAAGYVVLLPDSLSARGLDEICTIRASERALTAARRKLDALGALVWLASQPGIARERIALLGWSHGGSTVLAAINAADPIVNSAAPAFGAPIQLRAAVAFYPGCAPSLANPKWRPSTSTRILIGDADDWTPAAPCASLHARAKERGWPLETTLYEGAHHGFDAPSGDVRLREDVPNGVNPGRGVHVGANPAAREDAHRRVDAFLAERFGR